MTIKTLRNTCLAICALLLAAAGSSAQTAGPVATKELFNEIAEKDRMLFDAVFNTCDVQATDGGADILVVTSAARFRAPNGGYSLVFRMEGGRAAAVTFEQSGEPIGGEMLRVP